MGHSDFNGYYKILGLTYPATQIDIKKAWLICVKKFHPDVNKNPNATIDFQKLQKSYDTLKDEQKKADYDRACQEDFNRKEAQRKNEEERRERQKRNAENRRREEKQRQEDSNRKEAHHKSEEEQRERQKRDDEYKRREAERRKKEAKNNFKETLTYFDVIKSFFSYDLKRVIKPLLALSAFLSFSALLIFFIFKINTLFNTDHAQSPAAFVALIKQAKTGNTEAEVKLGDMYQNGTGVPANYEKLILEKIGLFKRNGNNIKINYNKAFSFYKEAADNNNQAAAFKLGDIYYNGYHDMSGYNDIALFLRSFFTRHDDIAPNYKRAFFWFQESTNLGNPDAQTSLGLMYLHGENVQQDQQKAFSLLTPAAEQGNAKAQITMGLRYLTGEGVPSNLEKALSLIQRASNQGNPQAESCLGLIYLYGELLPRNTEKAFILLQHAADMGNVRWTRFFGQVVKL